MNSDQDQRPDLELVVPGASAEAIQRGIAAAMALFEQRGFTPAEGAWGDGVRETYDLSGFDEAIAPTNEHHEAAEAWLEAQEAAIEACCSGWATKPKDWQMSLQPWAFARRLNEQAKAANSNDTEPPRGSIAA